MDHVRFSDLGRAVTAWLGGRGESPVSGATPAGDAHRLVEIERAAGAPAPDGCAWLDDVTIDDLELAAVLTTVDRTVSPIGAQQLWRMIAAPAVRLDVLAARERALARMAADPAGRARLRRVLARMAEPDTACVPVLLWSETPRLMIPGWGFRALALALLTCAIGGLVWPILFLPALLLFIGNTILDDRVNTKLARHARALQMFGLVLDVGARAANDELVPQALRDAIAAALPALRPLQRRLGMLTVRDPLDVSGVLIAALLLRPSAMAACLDVTIRERAAMRRLHQLVGELDALQAIATWRAECAGVAVPSLVAGPAMLEVHDLRHPAIAGAIGNDLALGDRSLILTGSNMSGKSTFLRALAVNAVLAQSIHTVCGAWRGSLFQVHAAMRAVDSTGTGTSTYAAEVAAIATLVAAAGPDAAPALFVLDEPFRGTNPAIRVPIVVAVLEYLAHGHVTAAATHDLEVARRLSDGFERGYFREVDAEGREAAFDYRLRAGTAVTTNAVTLLRRAGYPAAILDAIRVAIP